MQQPKYGNSRAVTASSSVRKVKKKERDLTPATVEVTYRERKSPDHPYKPVRKTRKTYHVDGTVSIEELKV